VARSSGSEPRVEVTLRDVTSDDLPILYEHQRDPEATAMAAFRARDWDAFVAHWTGIIADPTVAKQTILVEGDVAGNIVSFDGPGHREVGYWIGRPYWGKGVATAALSAFLRLETTRPLFGHVASHNVASKRVLERCGFTVAAETTVTEDDGEPVAEVVMKLEGGP
jgi:RimJ/RimL family protein N-acetyltransferase